jgi:hypothetical protein
VKSVLKSEYYTQQTWCQKQLYGAYAKRSNSITFIYSLSSEPRDATNENSMKTAGSSTTGLFFNTKADLVILARTTPAISPAYLMSDQDVHRSMLVKQNLSYPHPRFLILQSNYTESQNCRHLFTYRPFLCQFHHKTNGRLRVTKRYYLSITKTVALTIYIHIFDILHHSM